MADRNGYIGRAPGDSSVVVARQTFSPTGIQTDFTFASGYVVGYLDLYLNGARLIEGQDFTATDGSVVGLTTYAQNGDVLELVAYKAFNATNVQSAGGDFSVGGNLSVVGYTTANTYYGDGSNLTGITAGYWEKTDAGINTTSSVGIGTTNPTALLEVRPGSSGEGILLKTTENVYGTTKFDSNRTLESNFLGTIDYAWNGTTVAQIIGVAGDDTVNKDNAKIAFYTASAGSPTHRATIDSSGRLLLGTESSSVQMTQLLQGNSANAQSYGTLYLARGVNNPSDSQFLGEINFSDNSHDSSASIRAIRDGGTWTSTSSQPSALIFETTSDGQSNPIERPVSYTHLTLPTTSRV